MSGGATEIKKDAPDSFVIHEYTAVTLALMMGSKIIFRQAAWVNAETLWNLPPLLTDNLKHSIDGFTTVVGKTLLVPVP